MKKIILGLSIGLASVTAWSACTYNFDATQAQLNILYGGAPNGTLYPNVTGQKFGFNLLAGLPVGASGAYRVHAAASKAYLDKAIAAQSTQNATLNRSLITNKLSNQTKNLSLRSLNQAVSQQVEAGDKPISQTGIIAYEFNFKVPDNLTPDGQVIHFPIGIGGDTVNGNGYAIAIFYGNQYSTEASSSTNGFAAVIGSMNLATGTQDQKEIALFNVTNPAQIQKVGIYFNQSSNQIGIISNGQNLGYVYTLPGRAKNVAFSLASAYRDIQPTDLNKEVSIELVTDSSKITGQYPTGTTDICGVAL
ncbi:DUF4882 family protein [Acinetobacter sp. Marseille-Q1618]|uniref:DUF4882 family protein n=1 Tax=Acinetobacter sp. Marseille-Q1618 TaxID=2697502 RepID=UPI00156D6216|nr:DUF4882 family protein [Acinetobacter sp. Marseille-Q1618]